MYIYIIEYIERERESQIIAANIHSNTQIGLGHMGRPVQLRSGLPLLLGFRFLHLEPVRHKSTSIYVNPKRMEYSILKGNEQNQVQWFS